jgi:hypothetical protein
MTEHTDADGADDEAPPRYARGAELSQVPLASEVPRPNLKELLGIDSANPILREARIDAGFLPADEVPRVGRSLCYK